MKITKENIPSLIKKVVGAIFGIAFGYFIISASLGMAFGIKSPQPFYNEKPFKMVISDPHAKSAYKKSVKPQEIQSLLDHHRYAHEYKEGVFDCSDMSKEVARYLTSQGYHASVIGDDKNEHAWAIVWVSKNTGWAIESTAVSELKHNAGEVIGDDWYDFTFVWESMFDKNPYELYYPSVSRDGLHVLDWNNPEVDLH